MRPELLGRAIRGILFDKDGTLVDFDRTWGPAAYSVIGLAWRP
jgi:phosphoglycolate phosphatase